MNYLLIYLETIDQTIENHDKRRDLWKKILKSFVPKVLSQPWMPPDMIIYSLSKHDHLNCMKLKRTGICWANFKHDRLVIQMESISTIFIMFFYPQEQRFIHNYQFKPLIEVRVALHMYQEQWPRS